MNGNDISMRLMQLSRDGFCCSQSILMMGLEYDGRENPELIRAMGGLCGGLGGSGEDCGALTGACCLLGLFLSKGTPEETADPACREIISSYVEWFQNEAVPDCPGCVTCRDILKGVPGRRLTVCPGLVQRCYEKAMEMLAEHGAI
jgi:C_GCAxxG_C_C family probable redox protein